MSQLVIDPGEVSDVIGNISVALLPKVTRQFGFVPDFRAACLPGDLVLFRGRASGFAENATVRAQRAAGFSDEHSVWTHAGLYLYDDLVVEAVPFRGVRTRSLYSDIPSRILRIRRQPGLDEIKRYKVALRALQMVGARYSVMSALFLGWRMGRGIWNPAALPLLGPVVICSQVFHDAHIEITQSRFEGCRPSDLVTPATSARPEALRM